jgi:GNAT superfamily N-acetyltransferase
MATSKAFVTQRDLPKPERIKPAAEPRPLVIRSGAIDDVNCIINDWAASYKESPEVQEMDPEVYKVEQRARIFRLLGASKVSVACDPDNHSKILGWVVHGWDKGAQAPIVHYMYVKREFRLARVGTRLMRHIGWVPGQVVWATHWQPCIRKLRHKWNWLYNRYLLEAPNDVSKTRSAVTGQY